MQKVLVIWGNFKIYYQMITALISNIFHPMLIFSLNKLYLKEKFFETVFIAKSSKNLN